MIDRNNERIRIPCVDCKFFDDDEYICMLDGEETNEINGCPRGEIKAAQSNAK